METYIWIINIKEPKSKMTGDDLGNKKSKLNTTDTFGRKFEDIHFHYYSLFLSNFATQNTFRGLGSMSTSEFNSVLYGFKITKYGV